MINGNEGTGGDSPTVNADPRPNGTSAGDVTAAAVSPITTGRSLPTLQQHPFSSPVSTSGDGAMIFRDDTNDSMECTHAPLPTTSRPPTAAGAGAVADADATTSKRKPQALSSASSHNSTDSNSTDSPYPGGGPSSSDFRLGRSQIQHGYTPHTQSSTNDVYSNNHSNTNHGSAFAGGSDGIFSSDQAMPPYPPPQHRANRRMPRLIHDILEGGRTKAGGQAQDTSSSASVSAVSKASSYAFSEYAVDGSQAGMETKSVVSRISHGDKTVKVQNYDPNKPRYNNNNAAESPRTTSLLTPGTTTSSPSYMYHHTNLNYPHNNSRSLENVNEYKDVEIAEAPEVENNHNIIVEHSKDETYLWGSKTKRIVIIGLVIVFLFGIITLIVSIIMSARTSRASSSNNNPMVTQQGEQGQGLSSLLQTTSPSALFNPGRLTMPPSLPALPERNNKLPTTTATTASPTISDNMVSIALTSQQSKQNATLSPLESLPSETFLDEEIAEQIAEETADPPSQESSTVASSYSAIPETSISTNVVEKTQIPETTSTTMGNDVLSSPAKPTAFTLQRNDELEINATVLDLVDTIRGLQPRETFGYSTSLSLDGHVLVVGAPYAALDQKDRVGRLHVYEKHFDESNNVSWVQRGDYIYGNNIMDQLGFAVTCNHDGSVIVASEPTYGLDRRGRVKVFEFNRETNKYEQKFVVEGDEVSNHFGVSLSITPNADRLVIGSPYHSLGGALRLSGQVRVYDRKPGATNGDHNWEIIGTPLQGSYSADWFGWAVDISHDGKVLLVGAPRNKDYGGYVRCFLYDDTPNDGTNGTWNQLGPDIINEMYPVATNDLFGHALSLNYDLEKNRLWIAIGIPWKNMRDFDNSGLVAVYKYDFGANDINSLSDHTDLEWKLLGNPLETAPSVSTGTGAPMSTDQQFGYSLKLISNMLVVGSPGAINRRGEITMWILEDEDGEVDKESVWVKSPTNTVIGEKEGDDYGFALDVAFDQDDANGAGSIICAIGAVMLRSSDQIANTGYVQILHSVLQ